MQINDIEDVLVV